MFRMSRIVSLTCAVALTAVLSACSSGPEKEAPVVSTAQPSASSIKPGSPEDFRVNVGDTVFFDVDQHTIRPDSQAVLQKQAAWLQKYPTVRLMVEGHCDERGTREFNLALGDRRAYAVKEFLVSMGVDAARLQSKSYGKERPVCAESDDSCWQQNRRGYSVISSGAGS